MNKGFTFIETAVVLLIISMLSLLSFKSNIFVYESIYIETKQLEAMAKGERTEVLSGLSFNYNGNINHGQTVKIQGKECIFQLGFGRYHCE